MTATVLIGEEFEGAGSPDLAGTWATSGNGGAAFQRRTDIARVGRGSLRVVLDRAFPNEYRSELSANPLFQATDGLDYHVGMSVWVDPELYTLDTVPTNVLQWHNTPDPGEEDVTSVPLSFRIQAGLWQFYRRSSSADPTTNGSISETQIQLDPVLPGWHDWVIHSRFDHSGSGALTVWHNGAKRIAYTGALGFNDSVGPYLKFGVYISLWDGGAATLTERQELTFDELRVTVGGGYADVAPRVAPGRAHSVGGLL